MEIPSFAVMLAAAQRCITAFILRPFAWRPCGRSVAARARPWPIPAAPGCRPSGPGCGRRHVLTRGHHRCPLSAPFSPRPSSPVRAHRASIQWPQAVARQRLRSLLTQATVSPDPFAMVRHSPGTHRALPGPEVFFMFVLITANQIISLLSGGCHPAGRRKLVASAPAADFCILFSPAASPPSTRPARVRVHPFAIAIGCKFYLSRQLRCQRLDCRTHAG